MVRKRIIIATRKSPLALWQANHIKAQLLHFFPSITVELLPLTTSGDKFLQDKLQDTGGKGLFTKELEEAILQNKADIAVHSMKDVPAILPEGLLITAFSERHNPLDAFVSNTYQNFRELPKNAIVGTSSLRRQAQLLAMRPDLTIRTLRGNINTRLEKLKRENFDAIILAVAGLQRLQLGHTIKEIFSAEDILPAPGQGVMGIECRTDDLELQEMLSLVNHEHTARCVSVERLVNLRLGGSCQTPIAIYCQLDDGYLSLKARVASPDGKKIIEISQKDLPINSEHFAQFCAQKLLDDGAATLLQPFKS